MGIDVHGLNWIKYALAGDKKQRILTIGRQAVLISPEQLKDQFNLVADRNSPFAESLLKQVAQADSVDSFDYSDYEAATIVGDLNLPVITNLHSKFDLVIDGGCLEHVFNISEALLNLSRMCVPGGTIIHILPANNFNGHGFWQFSAEVFFSLYSHANGYINTDVVFASLPDTVHWYRVIPPEAGRRVHMHSRHPTYILVRTTKTGNCKACPQVQQSDYVTQWEQENSSAEIQVKGLPASLQTARSLLMPLRKYPATRRIFNTFREFSQGLHRFNPNLRKRRVFDMLI